MKIIQFPQPQCAECRIRLSVSPAENQYVLIEHPVNHSCSQEKLRALMQYSIIEIPEKPHE